MDVFQVLHGGLECMHGVAGDIVTPVVAHARFRVYRRLQAVHGAKSVSDLFVLCVSMPGERVKLTDEQQEAIKDYNKSHEAKVNLHYAAYRAQWLNDNIFSPAGVELCPIPPPHKLKKAIADSARASGRSTGTQEATSSMSAPKGKGAGPSRPSSSFMKLEVDGDKFTDMVKKAVEEELDDAKDCYFQKSDGKVLLVDIKSIIKETCMEMVPKIVGEVVSITQTTYLSPHISPSAFNNTLITIPCIIFNVLQVKQIRPLLVPTLSSPGAGPSRPRTLLQVPPGSTLPKRTPPVLPKVNSKCSDVTE